MFSAAAIFRYCHYLLARAARLLMITILMRYALSTWRYIRSLLLLLLPARHVAADVADACRCHAMR